MKVINLFGEPSVGKSTTAAGLFALMKLKGYNVELVTEYAKQCVWEDRKLTLNDQFYVSAKQNHQLERLKDKVEFVINDSPLLLGILYSRDSARFPSLHKLLVEVFFSYQNFNILLQRSKPYRQCGRIQNEVQAAAVRQQLVFLLNDHHVNYCEMLGDKNAPRHILKQLKNPKVWLRTK